jgi:uncharacterized protein (DUF302 family)
MSYHVTVDHSAPHIVLELRRTVHADRAGDDIGNGMRALYELAGTTGLVPTGPPSTTYRGEFGPGTGTEADFTLPVSGGSLAGADEKVTIRKSEPGMHARTTHHGDYRRIGDAYRAVDEWIRTSEFRPVGPPTEVYLIGPDDAMSSHDLLTEIRVPIAPAELTVRVSAPFTDTLATVRTALAEQGFGVLTEIDVRATLLAKLGTTMENYTILGACNPGLAHRALEIDRRIGLLLPCNVVVRTDGDTTVVEAVDPDLLVQQTGQPAMDPIARAARVGLAAALDLLVKHWASAGPHRRRVQGRNRN